MASSETDSRDLTQGPVSEHLIRMSGFMMLSMMSFMGASLLEMLFIGWVGTNELAAISFTFAVVYSLQGASMGLGIGAASVVARATGSGDQDRVKRILTHCIVLGTALSIVLALVVSQWLVEIFSLLGASGEVLDLVVGYMELWLIGMPVFTMTFVGTTLMRAVGDAKTPGYVSSLGSVLHVLFIPPFIFGWGPIPELGLTGAAIGFIIARHLAFGMFIYTFVIRDRMLVAQLQGFVSSCREILHVGFPAMASNMIMPISMSILTRLLAGHGVVVVAGFGVASRIESMFAMVIWAVGMSASPLIGQNWGARARDRVQRVMRLGYVFVLTWGVIAYLILLAFGDIFVGLLNSDAGVIHAAYVYLAIAPIALGAMGVMNVANNAFNSLGKPMPPLVLSLMQMIVINIPMMLLGDYYFGYPGIFAGSALTSILLALVAYRWIGTTVRDASMPLAAGDFKDLQKSAG